MSEFVKLQDEKYRDWFYVNLNCIAYFSPEANIVFLSTVHGDGDGIIRITPESSRRLLGVIEMREINYEALKGAEHED